MISTNQIAYFKRSAVFLRMMKFVWLLRFRVTLGMYSTQILGSKLPNYFQSNKGNDWLVNMISTEHDQ